MDDYTVKITTDGPQSGLLADLTHHGNYILPANLIESGHDFNEEPIGTGPISWWNGSGRRAWSLKLLRTISTGAAPIKHVIWKIIPEGSSRTMALEAGEVDMIIEVETTDMNRISETEGLTLYSSQGTSHNYMTINNEIAPFNNKDFRKAIAAAIDKAAIVQVALNGDGTPVGRHGPGLFPGNDGRERSHL